MVKSSTAKKMRRLAGRRESLLQAWDDEDLHQLRIGLRRMRSRLKYESGGKARHLRRQLATLAECTNAARDWDTLAQRARRDLESEHLRRLQPFIIEQQRVAHETVQQMLRSEQWSGAMAEWKKFAGKRSQGGHDHPAGATEIERTRRRARRAWNRVQADNSSRNWHKLRIAIKDLRYTLDRVPANERDKSLKKTIKLCKRLQEYLGDWHDAVVHRLLLRQLGIRHDDPERLELRQILVEWQAAMEYEGKNYLQKTRKTLTEHLQLLGGEGDA
jgi:CHAD domain-containing protein